jgi:hypothetical protein
MRLLAAAAGSQAGGLSMQPEAQLKLLPSPFFPASSLRLPSSFFSIKVRRAIAWPEDI